MTFLNNLIFLFYIKYESILSKFLNIYEFTLKYTECYIQTEKNMPKYSLKISIKHTLYKKISIHIKLHIISQKCANNKYFMTSKFYPTYIF